MKKYDIIVIGMGPAGMAVSAMGTAMGLSVLAIENNKVGGECLNCGCIPSKALLKAGEANFIANNLKKYGLELEGETKVLDPLQIVRDKVSSINGPKTMNMFKKVDFILNQGFAEFVNKHTVKVGEKRYRAKKIFIATGTKPFIPKISGLNDVPILTNINIFEQREIPDSLTIIGGGAIGTEMAQAFSRLGGKVVILQMDPYLIPNGDEEAGRILEEQFVKEGIEVFNSTKISKVEEKNGKIITHTNKGIFESDKILVATGRVPVLEPLKLDKVGVKYSKRGIIVDEKMRTNIKNIFAIGDCNGYSLLSHAAMHQGMLALMNSIVPSFISFKREKYYVPCSVFTKPEVAQVGMTEKEAKSKGLKVKIIKEMYESYGRTVADGYPEGFVKVVTDWKGKIYGATIVGEAASEMIQEWTLAMQTKRNLFHILMMQHSFPTISLMNKRIAETWMMKKVENKMIRKIIKILF